MVFHEDHCPPRSVGQRTHGSAPGAYAMAAVIPGGRAAIIGAFIEGSWAAYAGNYYSHGNCIKIHYWLTVSEIEYGSEGCW